MRAHRGTSLFPNDLEFHIFEFLNDAALNRASLHNRTNIVRTMTKAKDKQYTKFKTIFLCCSRCSINRHMAAPQTATY
jgi:hypothetical protein